MGLANEQQELVPQFRFGVLWAALWPRLKEHRPAFLLGLFLIFITTVIQLIAPLLMGKAVEAVAETPVNVKQLKVATITYFILALLRALFESVQAYVIQSTGQKVTHSLRCLVFDRISSLAVPYFDQQSSGRLLTRVTNDIKALSELFTASISVLILDGCVIAGTIVAMLILEFKLALAVLATFPFVIIVVRYFGKRLTESYRIVRSRLAEISAFLGENIAGMATIRRLGAEAERDTLFRNIVENHQAAQMKSLRVFAMLQPYTNIINGIAMATLLGLGGYWTSQGKLGVGVMVAFLGYVKNLFQPLRDMVEKYNTFLSASVAAERIVGILHESEEFHLDRGVDKMERMGSIEFSSVNFAYRGRTTLALNGVNFALMPKERLAVVGRTGSGKSSIVRLLLGFYDPLEGEVLVGGVSLAKWNRKSLRRLFGMVHQEMYFLAGSLRENLTLARTGVTDAELVSRCDDVGLWGLLERRGGLDFQIAEGGANLSTGEKQLLSLVRVLIGESPFLILDEATSNVDTISERRIFRSIDQVMAGRTCVVIAHRLSTIRTCHKVLGLRNGQVEFYGTRDEFESFRGRQEFFDETL